MAGSFRLATFNVENLDWSPSAEEEFERRLAVLRPLFSRLAADVICLQEVDAQRPTPQAPRRFLALDRLLADSAYENFHRATSLRPGAKTPADVHNLAILSRWPIVERRQIHHDIVARWSWTPPAEGGAPTTPIDIAFDRPLLYARIALPNGAALHVANLHLRAPRAVPLGYENGASCRSSRCWAEGQFLAAQKREGQALEARLFVERLFDAENDPLIAVCGDLNADEHDAPTRLLRGAPEEDMTEAPPRALLSLEARVAEPARFTVVHAGRRVLLDQILASRALAERCGEVDIFNEGLEDEVTAKDPILGSLHAPVVASFEL
ncbi:MAG: endonuclease [Methylocystaceae bacterium]|nr:MAG: endonuclease [Methylocystaceae bacterium]